MGIKKRVTLRYYWNADGTFIGSFDEDASAEIQKLPQGAFFTSQAPSNAKDTYVNGAIVPYTAPITTEEINSELEKQFAGFLPSHLGQAYLAGSVIREVMQVKVAVTDAIRFDPTGSLALSIINDLTVPREMDTDKAAIVKKLQELVTNV